MYHFAIVALMALAALKIVDFLCDIIPGAERVRSVLVFVAAIGGAWILDYSLFEGFGVYIRNHAVGVWMTGFMTAGVTVPWRALFGWMTENRATADESLGEHRPLRKAA